MTTDLFGPVPREPFTADIRNTRESVAQEKARLCMAINANLRRTPKFLATASADETRNWKRDHGKVKAVLNSKESSVPELKGALSQTEGWFK